jgi:hypothetical protein
LKTIRSGRLATAFGIATALAFATILALAIVLAHIAAGRAGAGFAFMAGAAAAEQTAGDDAGQCRCDEKCPLSSIHSFAVVVFCFWRQLITACRRCLKM